MARNIYDKSLVTNYITVFCCMITIKDILKTNNLLEGFFKITFHKKYKLRFRT